MNQKVTKVNESKQCMEGLQEEPVENGVSMPTVYCIQHQNWIAT